MCFDVSQIGRCPGGFSFALQMPGGPSTSLNFASCYPSLHTCSARACVNARQRVSSINPRHSPQSTNIPDRILPDQHRPLRRRPSTSTTTHHDCEPTCGPIAPEQELPSYLSNMCDDAEVLARGCGHLYDLEIRRCQTAVSNNITCPPAQRARVRYPQEDHDGKCKSCAGQSPPDSNW